MDESEHHKRHLESLHAPIVFVAFTALCVLAVGSYVLTGVLVPQKVASSAQPSLEPVTTAAPVPFVHDALSSVSPSAKILFVGDMFFDRQIRLVSDLYGSDYPFSCIDPLLLSADFVVGNMEGPITNEKSISLGTIPGSPNNYRFTFPTTTATTLLRHNIKVVSIGNNHIFNFGALGLASTHAYLSKAGVGYFGGVAQNEPVQREDINGISLSFVGYNEFGGNTPQQVADTIATEKSEGRQVVVFSHWGTEYSTSADSIRPLARQFAQSGAVAIFGAHPHVVGLHEMLGSTPVYYSLGNFIFDQYFSEDVRHGLAVMVTISKDGIVDSKEYPVVLKRDGRTCLVE